MIDDVVGGLIEMGINLAATALLIFSITTCLWIVNQYNDKVIDTQLVTDEVKDQRNNIYFDGTDVYAQDIINQVVKFQGDRSIRVELLNGSVLEWSKTHQETDFTISNVSNTIPRDAVYKSTLVRALDGYNVTGYKFVQFDPDSTTTVP